MNRFYLLNGFKVHSSFMKERTRGMNLYTFSLGSSADKSGRTVSKKRRMIGAPSCMLKRGFDIFASGVALLVLLPLMLVVAMLVRLDSPGPSLFRQTRVGKSFREFQLLKFRSMKAGNCGTEVTCGQDARITRAGAFLRAFKLDELPQLWNVFRGDMSLVGPRPRKCRCLLSGSDRNMKKSSVSGRESPGFRLRSGTGQRLRFLAGFKIRSTITPT